MGGVTNNVVPQLTVLFSKWTSGVLHNKYSPGLSGKRLRDSGRSSVPEVDLPDPL